SLSNSTTLLFGLAGVRVGRVVLLPDGTREVHVQTACEDAAACPSCGVISSSVKGNVTTSPRDIPYGTRRIVVLWHKRRWRCREALCPRRSFTETIGEVRGGGGVGGDGAARACRVRPARRRGARPAGAGPDPRHR